MRLTTLQEDACRSLEGVVKELQTTDLEEDMWSPLDSDTDAALDDKEVDDSDDEALEDVPEEGLENTEVRLEIYENSAQRRILDLLVSLFTHMPLGTDDKFYSPIIRFLVLFSLTKDGQWLPGRRISQVFAALLFCGREVMMALMHDEVNRTRSLRYSE
jgi:hypothetical protein